MPVIHVRESAGTNIDSNGNNSTTTNKSLPRVAGTVRDPILVKKNTKTAKPSVRTVRDGKATKATGATRDRRGINPDPKGDAAALKNKKARNMVELKVALRDRFDAKVEAIESKLNAKANALVNKAKSTVKAKVANSKAIIKDAALKVAESAKNQLKSMITSLLVVPEPVLLASLQTTAQLGGTPMYKNYYVLKAILKKDYVTIIQWFVKEYKWSVVSGNAAGILNQAATKYRATRVAIYLAKEKIKVKGPEWWRANRYTEIKKIIIYGKTHFKASDILEFMESGRVYVASDTIVNNGLTYLDKITNGLTDTITHLTELVGCANESVDYIYNKTPNMQLIESNRRSVITIMEAIIKTINAHDLELDITREYIADNFLTCIPYFNTMLDNLASSTDDYAHNIYTIIDNTLFWVMSIKDQYDDNNYLASVIWSNIAINIDQTLREFQEHTSLRMQEYIANATIPVELVTDLKSIINAMKSSMNSLSTLYATSSPSDTIMQRMADIVQTIENQWVIADEISSKMSTSMYTSRDSMLMYGVFLFHSTNLNHERIRLKTIQGEISTLQHTATYVNEFRSGTAPETHDISSRIDTFKACATNIIDDLEYDIPRMDDIRTNITGMSMSLKFISQNIYVPDNKIARLGNSIKSIELLATQVSNLYTAGALASGVINIDDEWCNTQHELLKTIDAKITAAIDVAMSGVMGAKPVVDDINADMSIYPGGLGENGCVDFGVRFKFTKAELNRFIPERQNQQNKIRYNNKESDQLITSIDSKGTTNQGLYWETFPATAEHATLLNAMLAAPPVPQKQYTLEHSIIRKRMKDNLVVINPIIGLMSNAIGSLIAEVKIDKLVKLIQDPSSLMYMYIKELEKNKLF
jgi:competence CoiA-like predicted nuclease